MIVQKRKNNPTSTIVCGVIALIAAVVVAIMGLQSPPELKNVSEIKAAEMSTDYSYYFEELVLMGHYMTQSGGDTGDGKYYIVAFTGEDEKVYAASLYADKDKEMKNMLWDYMKDADDESDALVISGCFKTRDITAIDNEGAFYDTSFNSLKKYALEEEGVQIIDTRLHLDYVCEDAADYEEEASMKMLLIVSAVFVVLGGVLIFFGNKAKKKLKAEAEARARFNENQPNEPGTYQGPEF